MEGIKVVRGVEMYMPESQGLHPDFEQATAIAEWISVQVIGGPESTRCDCSFLGL